MPIFYLKYIDDKKNVENIITGVQFTVDIVLTFSGIGNLSKLRHIRTVYKLGRAALGLEEVVAGDVLATYEFAQGVVGVVEIGSSLGNIFIQYSKKKEEFCDIHSNEYDKAKCEFYTKLDNIFIVLQLFGGVLDLATSKLISGSSRKLLEGPIPDDFNPDALAILRRFAGDIDELKEIFRVRLINEVGENSVIWQRIERAGSPGEFTIAKRDEFILDFERADKNTLVILNTDSDLINYWNEVAFLKDQRTGIDFLVNFRRFKDLKNNEFRHIWQLHGITGGHRYIYVTDNLNGNELFKVVSNNVNINTNIPLDLRTIKTDINGHTFYENLYRYNPNLDLSDPKVLTVNGLGVSRKTKHFTVNPAWSEQKLMEEMAFAYKNDTKVVLSSKAVKIKHGMVNEIRYKSRFTDGTKVEITYRSQDIDPISGNLVNDHISLFAISKQ